MVTELIVLFCILVVASYLGTTLALRQFHRNGASRTRFLTPNHERYLNSDRRDDTENEQSKR